jgi:alkylhydroperoxidase family enzyme
LNFERSDRFTPEQKTALKYTSMLVWDPEGVDDALWAELRRHFSDAQIVELGSFIAVTYGQQRLIKTWAVGHGEL